MLTNRTFRAGRRRHGWSRNDRRSRPLSIRLRTVRAGQPPTRTTSPSVATRRAGEAGGREPVEARRRPGRSPRSRPCWRRRTWPRRRTRSATATRPARRSADRSRWWSATVAAAPAADRRARRGDRAGLDRDRPRRRRFGRRLAVLGHEDAPAAGRWLARDRDVAAERDEDAAAVHRGQRAERRPRSAASALPIEPRSSSTPPRDPDRRGGRGRERTARQPGTASRRTSSGAPVDCDQARSRGRSRSAASPGRPSGRRRRPSVGRPAGRPRCASARSGLIATRWPDRAFRRDSSLSSRNRLSARSTSARTSSTARRAASRLRPWTTTRTPVPIARQAAASTSVMSRRSRRGRRSWWSSAPGWPGATSSRRRSSWWSRRSSSGRSHRLSRPR